MKVKSKTPAGKKSYQLVVDGVRPLTVHDCKERLLSFCMDLCVMLSPIAIWNVIY